MQASSLAMKVQRDDLACSLSDGWNLLRRMERLRRWQDELCRTAMAHPVVVAGLAPEPMVRILQLAR